MYFVRVRNVNSLARMWNSPSLSNIEMLHEKEPNSEEKFEIQRFLCNLIFDCFLQKATEETQIALWHVVE